jgi:predicted permease
LRLPFSVRGPLNAPIEVPGYAHGPDDVPYAEYNVVGPTYARAIGMPILTGRDLSDQDEEQSSPVAIVNETMARRYWPGGDAVGKQFSILGRSVQIVGIAKDAFYHSLTESPRPYVYLQALQFYQAQTTLIVRTRGDPTGVLSSIQTAVAHIDPQLPLYTVLPMNVYLGFAVVGQRTSSVLLAIFGALALMLASLGLYNAVAYTVATRKREVGIRLALGGRPTDVLGLLIRGGAVVTATGIALGLIVAAALARLVTNQIYGVSAMDPMTFAAAALIVSVTSLLAAGIPALAAVRADVTNALRYE